LRAVPLTRVTHSHSLLLAPGLQVVGYAPAAADYASDPLNHRGGPKLHLVCEMGRRVTDSTHSSHRAQQAQPTRHWRALLPTNSTVNSRTPLVTPLPPATRLQPTDRQTGTGATGGCGRRRIWPPSARRCWCATARPTPSAPRGTASALCARRAVGLSVGTPPGGGCLPPRRRCGCTRA
jgi:hypothetical protein